MIEEISIKFVTLDCAKSQGVLRKAVLMCDCSKGHVTENWCKRDTTTQKTDCPFDAVALMKDGQWKFCLRNRSHNHEAILLFFIFIIINLY